MKRQREHSSKKPASKKKRTGDYQKGRELNKQPKQELKGFDTAIQTLNSSTVANPPTFLTLNAMVNGAEMFNRVGRKTYAKSLRIRGKIYPIGATDEGGARIIIYYDSQANTAIPTIVNLLQDSNAAAATSWASGINLTNRQRFKILKDYQVLLGSSANIAGQTELVPDPILHTNNIDWFIPLKGLESIYNAVNGGTIADITSGALGITMVCDTVQTNWALDFTSRLRYYD